MTMLGVAVVLQVAIVGAGAEDYATAHKAITQTGKPMVVMVGADWCQACETMKQTVIPEAKRRGLLRKVAFAVVNLDRDRELGRQLTHDGPIPQLIMFRKGSDGWRRKVLIGSQSLQTVETFINEGVELNDAEQHVQPASHEQPPTGAQPKPERSASHDSSDEDDPQQG